MLMPMVATAADAAVERHWQKVMAGERKVGQVEHTRRVADGRVIRSEMLTLRLGTSQSRQTYVTRLETESTADGALLRLVRESKTPEGHTLIDARRTGDDELTVSIGAGAGKHTRILADTGPLWSEEVARQWLQAVGSGAAAEPLAYRTFDPNRLAIIEVRLSRVAATTAPYKVRRVVSAAHAVSESMQTLDVHGNVVDESIRLGRATLRLVGSTEAQARARNERLDHVAAQMQ